MESKGKEEKLLVLCVDRDGDIGARTEEKTPILGRKENLDAAVALALKDPEEPDANAIFEGIRLLDQLEKQGQPNEVFQIATISGSQLLGVEADRKIVRELNEVLKAFQANNVILVTDGFSDEAVLPLVESRVPVTSVRRIVMKHSESIEETAAVVGKYLRMLADNPRYSRLALGIPGLLLIILAIMFLGGWEYQIGIAFLIVLGATLLVKGFGFDRATLNLIKWLREYEPPSLPVQISGFAFVAGVLATAVGIYLGANGVLAVLEVLPTTLEEWISLLPMLTGQFIRQGIYLIVFGVCAALSGRAVRWYFERDIRLLRTLVTIVVFGWSSQIFFEVSRILIDPTIGWLGGGELVFAIFIGILFAIASSLVALVINLRYGSFFKRRKKKVEEFEQS
jgi:putative membrane protein